MSKSNRLQLALLIFVLVGLAAPILAHPSPFSYLDLHLDQSQLDGSLVVHVIDLAHELNVSPPESLLETGQAETKKEAILDLLRQRFVLIADGKQLEVGLSNIEILPDQQALKFHLTFATTSSPGAINIRCALFPYDPLHQTFLSIYEGEALTHQEIFSKDHTTFDYFTGTRQGTLAVVKKFVVSGVHHIFTGPDHILFIVGLLLLGGSLMRLMTIVTAFTIAHSITLSLAALDVLNPPARLIEPAIALSIIYVGIDNLMVGKEGRDVRAWIAFFFGFVHGFGFAGVLREFGLPRQALGWSMFSFNFGVELGQLCIVIVAATLLAILRKRNPPLGKQIATIGSVAVILAGSYWFIQRVFF
ncbi:MAG: HupE/UreJ family protein [Acidobacteria bacterium]|nr:HupE/UreJ family protein [Acidobacteriota bacterium]